jgi:hypothetical protein
MRNRSAGLLTLLSVCLIMTPVAQPRASTSPKAATSTTVRVDPEPSPIEYFNEQIILRFYDLEVAEFGLARIPTRGHDDTTYKRLLALTPREQAAEQELTEAGWEVGFYLGGRGLLRRSTISEAVWREGEQNGSTGHRHTISGPILLGRRKKSSDFPTPWELWEPGRKALIASKLTASYKDSVGRWTIEARPVRADRQECLNCHGSRQAVLDKSRDGAAPGALEIGDALGVVLYVYARSQARTEPDPPVAGTPAIAPRVATTRPHSSPAASSSGRNSSSTWSSTP